MDNQRCVNYAFKTINENFLNKDLLNANFEGATLKDIVVENCNFNYANFKNAKLENITFKSCNFSATNFENAVFENCDFFFCVGNGKDLFSMEVGEYPFVWDKHNIFIGCLKIPLKAFYNATTRDEKLLAKQEYKHFELHKETIKNAILNTTGILLEEKEVIYKGAKASYSSRFYCVEDGLIWLRNTPVDVLKG